MKFIKKAAALFFCLALALSVMAISASADGVDPGFSLSLSKSSSDTHTNIVGEAAPDYKLSDTVSYDIILSKTDSGTYDVNAVQFTLTYAAPLTNPVVTIGGQQLTEASGVYKYLAESYTTIGSTFAADGTPIGTIQFTTADSVTPAEGKTSAVGTFTLSNATAHYAANTKKADVDTGNDGVSASAEVHRNYTITLKRPNFDTTSGVKLNTVTNCDPASTTYNIVDGIPNSGTVATQSQAYYDFTGWTVEGTDGAENNWTSPIETTTNYTVPAGKYGDVTLTATFNSATYYVTYAQGDGAATEAVINRALVEGTESNAGKYAYTIDNVQADFGTATRPGYDFAGWKASNFAETTNWKATRIVNEETQQSEDVIYAVTGGEIIANMYGDVTLTPQWTEHQYTANFNVGSTLYNNTSEDTTLSSSSATYTITNVSNLSAVTVTRKGYDFTGWAVESVEATTNGTNSTETPSWTVNETTTPTVAAGTGDNANKGAFTASGYGTVTFKALWTPHTYTASLEKGVTGDNVSDADVTLGDNGATSVTYDIETITNLTALLNANAPTRIGYDFAGWKVTSDTDNEGRWTKDEVYTSSNPFVDNKYNDVTLTAQWTIVGQFKQVTYNFAYYSNRESGTGDRLMLFATNNSNTGTYKYDGATMFIANKYAALFEGVDTNSGWKVYATIAAENVNDDAGKLNVTFIGAETSANSELNYDGNVNGEDNVDVGDYGTAGTIFGNPASYQNVAAIGAEQRLKMDMSEEQETLSTSSTWLGNIYDLKAIMNAAS